MLTLETLRSYGANVDEALGRCMNNEAFYLRLVKMAVADGNFARLSESIENGDRDAAFEAAHALKGVLSNLALTPMLRPASELTELLRHKSPGDHRALLEEILRQREALLALIG